MKYIADTVSIIRFLFQKNKLGKKALKIYQNSQKGSFKIGIPIIVLVELMYLSQKKRIDLDFKNFVKSIKKSSNYKIIGLTEEIIILASKLKIRELHDCLIASTAYYYNLPLITCDKEITEHKKIKTIW